MGMLRTSRSGGRADAAADRAIGYWKIALNLWADFQPQHQRTDLDAHDLTLREFLLPLLKNALGYADLKTGAVIEASGHAYNIGHLSGDGRVPLILAAHGQDLDAPADRFGESNPETGKIRRRSPFMLAQEALNNAEKHSGAAALDFSLSGDDRWLTLEVRDDGRGFSPGGAKSRKDRAAGSLGLRIMDDAAASAGGSFSVYSRPGGGARLRADIPVRAGTSLL